jgi:alkylhydroperoxidase/carboxymuconolactone decarboxylase family protein YurZ
VGRPIKGEIYEFAPVINQFLNEQLFGDIFGRFALDVKTRKIATISALGSIGKTENQLHSHGRVH